MAPNGSKRIELKGLGDKRQITGVFCGTILGEFLPIQLIYGGKTNRCHPSYDFPSDWVISHSDNHWSNENTMLTYIEWIIVPYIKNIRESMGVDDSQAALAIFDHFKGQLTEKVTQLLEKHNIQSTLVPPSCTDRLQPLDISVNKSAKSFLNTEFQKWYSSEISKQVLITGDVNTIDPIDLTTSKMKCVSAQWFIRFFQYMQDRPDIVVNGFKAIAQSIDDGVPFLDNVILMMMTIMIVVMTMAQMHILAMSQCDH